MSNIEERVVKMEFDNKAFEKNAGETMSTLDKLKEVLKFDNVKGSFEKITNAAKKVDVSNVSDGIETVNAKLSTMQVVGATAISRITNGLMDFGKKVVGGTFGQIVQGGINRAFNIEQAKFTIEGLGKDFTQLKEDINYAVSGTAYGFDEAAKAASMMAASGIKAGDEMKAALRGISGLAAMTGGSYSEIADIMGNIAGRGKLSAQEINRFAVRGININAELQKAYHATSDEIEEMVRKGEIKFDQFAALMDNVFGEHATEANKTFTGAMSNIKASLSRIGAAFITPLIETNEKDALLLQSFDKLDKKLIKVAQDSNAVYEGGVNARSAFTEFARNYEGFTNDSSSMISSLIKGNEKAYIKGLKNAYDVGNASKEQLHEMYLENKKNLKGIIDDYSNYTGQTKEEILSSYDSAKKIFIKQLKEFPEYANKTNKELGKLYDNYTGFQYNIVTVLQAFKRMLGVIESSITTSSFLDFFIEKLEIFSERASLLFNAIAATFSGGILTITETIKNEKGEFEDITHEITSDKLWKSFGEAMGMTSDDLTNFLDTFKGIGSIFATVKDIVSSFFEILGSGSGVIKPISSILLSITGTIGRLVSAVLDSIRSFNIIGNVAKVISGVLKGIIGVVTAVVNAIVGAFTMITKNPVFDNIVHTLIIIGEGFNLLFHRIYDIGSAIVRFFIAPFKKAGIITEGTGHIITSVLELIADILWEFNKGLEDTIKRIDEFAATFIDFAGISVAGKKIAAAFKNGFDLSGIFGGEGGMFGDTVAGMSTDLAKSEKTASKKINGEGLGKALGGAIFTGMSFAVKALWNGFTFLADSLIGIIDKIDFGKVADYIFKGLEQISLLAVKGIDLVSKAFGSIGDALAKIDYTKVAAKVGTALSKLFEAVSKVFNNLSTLLSNAIETMIDNMPALNSSADKIGNAIGNALATGLDLVLTFVPVFVRIIWNALKSLGSKLPGILGKFSKNILKIFGVSFTGIFKKITDFVNNLSFMDALKAINLAELAVLLKALIDVAFSLKKSVGIFASMSNMFNGASGALKGMKKVFEAHYIKQLIISVGMMVALAYIISKLDPSRLAWGMIVLTAFGGILAGFTWLMGEVAPGIDTIKQFNKMLHQLSVMLISMTIALAVLSILNPTKLLGAVGALGIVLLELVFAVNMLNGCEKSMKSAALLGPLLLSIAGALAILSLFDFTTVMGSALAIAAVLAILVGLGAVSSIPAVAAGLSVLSAAITAFGIAVLAVGAGVFLFVSALQTLAMMGKDGSIESLGTAIQQLSSYIPILFQGIGQGILIMVQTLADGATIIADAFVHIVEVVLERLMQTSVMFATVGVTILLTLLHGILSAIGEITTTVIQIITAFTNNVSANMGEIVNSGMELMISFINGMANGLNEHSEEIWAAVKNLVGEIINFILTGLQSLVKEIPFIGGQISDGIEGAKGEIEKFFGDGKIEKESKKGAKKMTKAVEGETKSTADKATKQINKIPKALDSAAAKSKKSFKGVSNAAGKEFKEIPKMADIADKMAPKGKDAIEAWADKFAKGATKEKGKKPLENVRKGAESVDFAPAGKNIFNGIAKSFNYSDFYNQGWKRADAVDDGFKAREKISSPSKVWAQYGKYLYEGLAGSMRKTATKFYNTGANAAEGINAGFKSALDLISTLDTSSMSEPTIRPVLDLSNIRTGLNSMNSMFNGNRYALGIAGSLPASGMGSSSSRPMNVSATFNVNGADNPKEWADEFVQELEIQARTYNG